MNKRSDYTLRICWVLDAVCIVVVVVRVVNVCCFRVKYMIGERYKYNSIIYANFEENIYAKRVSGGFMDLRSFPWYDVVIYHYSRA